MAQRAATHKRSGVFESWLQQVLALAGLALLVVAAALGYGVWTVHEQQVHARAAVDRNFESGLVNRAVACRMTVMLGGTFEPDDPCLDPGVLRHYSPAATAPSLAAQQVARSVRVVCEVAAAVHVATPDCAAPATPAPGTP